MARKNKTHVEYRTRVVRDPGPSVPYTKGDRNQIEDRRQHRDFGLLKARGMKKPQSQKIIHGDKTREVVTRFERMSNEEIMRIINGTDMSQIRALSRFMSKTNGIYARAVRYMADLMRFDNMIYPNLDLQVNDIPEAKVKKILTRFNEILEHFDASPIQALCRKWANLVMLEGVCYGYIVEDVTDKLVIQDLPTDFCRSRFYNRGKPLIEFNAKYFDQITNDDKFREVILNLFPPEFREGYKKYKAGRLQPEWQGDEDAWFILDTQRAFKFNLNDSDMPPFLSAIPALLERDEIMDIAKEKLLQELQKILIQRFELDKNGQIPFSMVELQRLNQNAVDMVGDAVGVSVLSTVAHADLKDMKGDGGREAMDKIQAAEDAVFHELGISTNLFNTSGNLALEKSVLTDQGFVKPLLLQFEYFFNEYIIWKFNKKDSNFRMKMLETTIFNQKDLAKNYESLTKIGFSRFLPMMAYGHTQKEVASLARTEQQIMQLDNWMLPPFSSNTMSTDTWSEIKALQQAGGIKSAEEARALFDPEAPDNPDVGEEGGRPALPQDELSDKTIANQASQ